MMFYVSNSVGDGDFGDFKVRTSKDNLIIMRQLPRFRSSFEKELLKKVKIKINLKKTHKTPNISLLLWSVYCAYTCTR